MDRLHQSFIDRLHRPFMARFTLLASSHQEKAVLALGYEKIKISNSFYFAPISFCDSFVRSKCLPITQLDSLPK